MSWLDATPFGPLLGEIQTTNPTSLELAIVGIVTFLGYEIVARPGHARRNDALREQTPATSQAAEEPVAEQRRVA